MRTLLCALVIALSTTGCVTSQSTVNAQLNEIYTRIDGIFESCLQTTPIATVSSCGREYLTNHQRLPDTYQKPAWLNYARSVYRATNGIESGRLKNWEEFSAEIEKAISLWNAEMNYAVAKEERRAAMDFWGRLGDAGKAYNESIRQQQPSLRCTSRPSISGTVTTICD